MSKEKLTLVGWVGRREGRALVANAEHVVWSWRMVNSVQFIVDNKNRLLRSLSADENSGFITVLTNSSLSSKLCSLNGKYFPTQELIHVISHVTIKTICRSHQNSPNATVFKQDLLVQPFIGNFYV